MEQIEDAGRWVWRLVAMSGVPLGVGLFVGPSYATTYAQARGWRVQATESKGGAA